MRKYTAALAIVGLVAFSFFIFAVEAQNVSPASAQMNASAERIDSFSSEIFLEQRGGLKITETIVYSFGDIERHGIYRDIPLAYNGGKNNISITDISVVNENGLPYTFNIFKEDGFRRIKIGDPEEFVSGSKTYVISYLVDGAVQWGKASDRVIWNVTGDGWFAPIFLASVDFDLAPDINAENIEYECYQGPYGSTEPCNRSLNTTGKIGFVSQGFIDPGEGMTLSITLPKGVLVPPTPSELFWKTVFAYLPTLLPLAVFIFLFRRWQKHGRDPKGRGTIIPQYEPPADMSPIEMGTLLNGRMKSAHISAQIIYLATRGFLKVVPVGDDSGKPDDYILEKLKDATPQDTVLDRSLAMLLFLSVDTANVWNILKSVMKSKGENTEETITKIQEDLPQRDSVKISELNKGLIELVKNMEEVTYKELLRKKYYDRDPRKVFGTYLLIALPVLILSFFFDFNTVLMVSGIVSALVIGVFGFIMPKVTPQGALEKEHILGFKEYLDIAEKDRLNFHNAPERTPELFERFLPYALALGVVDAWAKEFEGIYTEPPKWYGGEWHGAFLVSQFGHSMQNFNSMSGQALAAGSSGSGGGGFSGGGAGGGGGGSW